MAAVKPEISPDEEPVSEVTASDADGWVLLDGMRRKLDDQATLARKTQTQVGQLAESIAALVEQQRRRSRTLNLNSFVAYAIFTILLGGGFYVLFNSRASELVAERDRATKDRDLATKRADAATAELAKRDADRATADQARRDAEARQTQVESIDMAFKTALAAFKAGRYAEVIAPLEAALASDPTGPRATQIKYYVGVAYAKGNELDKAIAHLTAAVAGEVEIDDARFQLASALDRAGQYPKARAEYDRFATAKPQSPHAVFAMRRSATLARMPATPVGAGSGSAKVLAAPLPGAPKTVPRPGAGSAVLKAPIVPKAPAAGSGSAAGSDSPVTPTGNPSEDAPP